MSKNKYKKENSRNNMWIIQDSSSISLNSKWREVVKDKLFPAIKNIIEKEIKKEKPNLRKIAILNYFAKTIWYDYYISIPDRVY